MRGVVRPIAHEGHPPLTCEPDAHVHCQMCGTTEGVVYGPPTATGDRFPALCSECRRGTLRSPKETAS